MPSAQRRSPTHCQAAIFFCLLCLNAHNPLLATFSANFSAFLAQKYGNSTEEWLSRRDLGTRGSFGGGQHEAGQRTSRRPVIMVHGLSTVAGDYEGIRQFLLAKNYSDAEVFASSYGNGVLNWTKDSIECQHVKRFRLMILAVSEYSDSNVDLVGYSMGSPLARKAVLGGHCVDTGEHLGPPLTSLVHTFLGVAGANRDAVYLCKLLASRQSGPCNNVSGISCHSRFLDDLNLHNGLRYEASKWIFTIYSVADEIVGYKDCDGQLVSTVAGQDFGLKLMAHTHFTAIFLTAREQLELLSGQHEPKLNVTVNLFGKQFPPLNPFL